MLTPINPFSNPGFDFGPRRRIQILPEDFGEETAHGIGAGDFYQSTGLGDPSADDMLREQMMMRPATRAKGPRGIAGILLGDDVEDDTVGSPETDAVTLNRSSLPGLDRPQLDAERVSGARRTAGMAGLAGLLDVALNGGDSGLASAAGGVMRGAQGIEAREQARYQSELGTYTDLLGERYEREDRMRRELALRQMQEEGLTERTQMEEAGRRERELIGAETDKMEEEGRMLRDRITEGRYAFQFAVDQGSEDAAAAAAELVGIDPEQARAMARRVRETEDAEAKLKLRQEARQWFQAQTGRINATRPRSTSGGSRSGSSGGDIRSDVAWVLSTIEEHGENSSQARIAKRTFKRDTGLDWEEYASENGAAMPARASGGLFFGPSQQDIDDAMEAHRAGLMSREEVFAITGRYPD